MARQRYSSPRALEEGSMGSPGGSLGRRRGHSGGSDDESTTSDATREYLVRGAVVWCGVVWCAVEVRRNLGWCGMVLMYASNLTAVRAYVMVWSYGSTLCCAVLCSVLCRGAVRCRSVRDVVPCGVVPCYFVNSTTRAHTRCTHVIHLKLHPKRKMTDCHTLAHHTGTNTPHTCIRMVYWAVLGRWEDQYARGRGGR